MENVVAKTLMQAVPLPEAVQLLEKLISVKTVDPPGNESTLLPLIKYAFEKIGAKWYIVEKKKGRSNFIGKIGHGGPSIGFFAHLDTVPPGDGWRTDPFKPYLHNGRIYGRGAIDCKGNFVAAWAAIKTFLSLHPHFKGTIYLVGCADEETGSENGVIYLLKKGFSVDYAIVSDGGYYDKVIIGEKGIMSLLIKSYGRQAHAAHPEKGVNAVSHLITFLQEFDKLNFSHLKHDPAFEDVTKNIGIIKGGSASNTIPAYAEAEIDIRYPLGVTKTEVLEIIRQLEKKLKEKDKTIHITLHTVFAAKPHLIKRDSPLMGTFLTSANALHMDLEPITIGGNTDAKPLTFAGIQSVVHGLKGSQIAHMANEFCTIEDIRKAAALYTLTLMKIFGVE